MNDKVLDELKKLGDTAIISFRVPLYIKVMYSKMNPEAKALLKQIVMSIITSGQLNVSIEQKIINLNININNNEVRPSISVGVAQEELEVLRKENKILKKKIRLLEEQVKLVAQERPRVPDIAQYWAAEIKAAVEDLRFAEHVMGTDPATAKRNLQDAIKRLTKLALAKAGVVA